MTEDARDAVLIDVDVAGSLWVSIPRGTIVREESKENFAFKRNGANVRETETIRYKRKRTHPVSDAPPRGSH